MAHQLALPLEMRAAQGRGDFIVAPCNESAVRFIDRWPDWPACAAALHGPEGSGKSHLAEVWRAKSGAQIISAASLNNETIATLPPGMAVAIEDADSIAPSATRDHALLALFERPSGTLLFTATREPREWPIAVADLKSRFASLLAFPVWAPDDALLQNLARKLFADRRLTVSDAVVARMLHALERMPAAIRDFVAEADHAALAQHRPVSDRLVSELLDRRNMAKGS